MRILLLAISVAISTLTYAQVTDSIASEPSLVEQPPSSSMVEESPAAPLQVQEEPSYGADAEDSPIAEQVNGQDHARELFELAVRDLEQQSLMAEATRAMAQLAWWQLGISALGAIMLVATVSYTRDAVAASKAATLLMNHSMRAQLRAYLCFGELEASWGGEGLGRNTMVIRLFVSWTNRGQTPAFNVRTTFSSMFLNSDHPTELPLLVHAGNVDRGALGHSDSTEAREFFVVTEEQQQEIRRSRGCFALQFRAHYDDYMGREIEQTVTGIFNPYGLIVTRSQTRTGISITRMGKNSETIREPRATD